MNAIDVSELDVSCFNGCYRDLVELIGHDNTLILYRAYAGQYVSFPKKLLADSFVHEQIIKEYNSVNAKELARKYGYTYSWIMKLIKKLKD